MTGTALDNGAYAAWGEVTSRPPDPPPTVDPEGVEQVAVHSEGPRAVKDFAPGNGNGHARVPVSGNGHQSPADVPTEPGAVTTTPAPPEISPVAPLLARASAAHLQEVARTAALRPPGGLPFTVLVPHTAAVTEPGAPGGSPGVDGGILIVEDDANVAKVYRLLLESKGHTVRVASDGVVAMDEVRRSRPDLILLDVMMPRMNGILFLQSVRAQAELRDVPVVILSNFREPRLVDRAMSLGAVEYVVKAQTKPELLLAAIPRWMAGERAFSR